MAARHDAEYGRLRGACGDHRAGCATCVLWPRRIYCDEGFVLAMAAYDFAVATEPIAADVLAKPTRSVAPTDPIE